MNPSHVDVSTQGNLQQLDPNFIGLIMSVFDPQNRVQITAFQSHQGECRTVPLVIAPLKSQQDTFTQLGVALAKTLLEEERAVFNACIKQNEGNSVAQGYHCTVYLMTLIELFDKLVHPVENVFQHRFSRLGMRRQGQAADSFLSKNGI